MVSPIVEGVGYKGRKIRVRWKGVYIKGVREKSIALAGEPVDLTSDDDDGWRRLATENGPAQRQVDVSVSGVTKQSDLKEDWFTGDTEGELIIEYPTGHVLTIATAMLVNYTDTGPYNDATTFEASFQSSGAATWDYAAS